MLGDWSVSRSEVGSVCFTGFIGSWIVLSIDHGQVIIILGDFSGFVLGYVYCFTCVFYEFSHQPSLTRFICLLVCERIAGAPFIPRCSMSWMWNLDAYRRASDADAELGVFHIISCFYHFILLMESNIHCPVVGHM